MARSMTLELLILKLDQHFSRYCDDPRAVEKKTDDTIKKIMKEGVHACDPDIVRLLTGKLAS